MSDIQPTPSEAAGISAHNITQLVYILQAVAFLLPFLWIVAVIVNYVKRDDVQGTWMESHFRWQMRSFWFGMLWMAIGGITFIIVIGMFVLAATYVWLIYRVVKGWLDFNARKPMYRQG